MHKFICLLIFTVSLVSFQHEAVAKDMLARGPSILKKQKYNISRFVEDKGANIDMDQNGVDDLFRVYEGGKLKELYTDANEDGYKDSHFQYNLKGQLVRTLKSRNFDRFTDFVEECNSSGCTQYLDDNYDGFFEKKIERAKNADKILISEYRRTKSNRKWDLVKSYNALSYMAKTKAEVTEGAAVSECSGNCGPKTPTQYNGIEDIISAMEKFDSKDFEKLEKVSFDGGLTSYYVTPYGVLIHESCDKSDLLGLARVNQQIKGSLNTFDKCMNDVMNVSGDSDVGDVTSRWQKHNIKANIIAPLVELFSIGPIEKKLKIDCVPGKTSYDMATYLTKGGTFSSIAKIDKDGKLDGYEQTKFNKLIKVTPKTYSRVPTPRLHIAQASFDSFMGRVGEKVLLHEIVHAATSSTHSDVADYAIAMEALCYSDKQYLEVKSSAKNILAIGANQSIDAIRDNYTKIFNEEAALLSELDKKAYLLDVKNMEIPQFLADAGRIQTEDGHREDFLVQALKILIDSDVSNMDEKQFIFSMLPIFQDGLLLLVSDQESFEYLRGLFLYYRKEGPMPEIEYIDSESSELVKLILNTVRSKKFSSKDYKLLADRLSENNPSSKVSELISYITRQENGLSAARNR